LERVLVTGGAGYIGSMLVPSLIERGYHVTVVDNFVYKQNSLANVCASKNFSVAKCDVRDSQKMRAYIEAADIIIPLAALVGAPICEQNAVGAKSINHDSILELLAASSSQQLILMPTTNSAYGDGDENNFCTEESELRPISQYAIDKVLIEKELMQRENSVSFRLATVFGMSPRMRLDLLVNDFVYRAVKDGYIVLFESHFKRNYIHVRDVVNAFLFALDNLDGMRGEIFNVGLSSANISKKELCLEIQEQVSNFLIYEEEIRQDPDKRNYIVSNEKIESRGFAPQHNISDGISELIKGYQMISNSMYTNV